MVFLPYLEEVTITAAPSEWPDWIMVCLIFKEAPFGCNPN